MNTENLNPTNLYRKKGIEFRFILYSLLLFCVSCHALDSWSAVNHLSYGACNGGHCINVDKVPPNWSASTTISVNGEMTQTLKGPEGEIETILIDMDEGELLEKLLKSHVDSFPEGAILQEEALSSRLKYTYITTTQYPYEPACATLFLIPHHDEDALLSIAYPSRVSERGELCHILRQIVPTYSVSFE